MEESIGRNGKKRIKRKLNYCVVWSTREFAARHCVFQFSIGSSLPPPKFSQVHNLKPEPIQSSGVVRALLVFLLRGRENKFESFWPFNVSDNKRKNRKHTNLMSSECLGDWWGWWAGRYEMLRWGACFLSVLLNFNTRYYPNERGLKDLVMISLRFNPCS